MINDIPEFIDLLGNPVHRPKSYAPWRPAVKLAIKPHPGRKNYLKWAAVWFCDDGHYHAWEADRLDNGAGDWQIGHEIPTEDADAMMAIKFPELYLKGYVSGVHCNGKWIPDGYRCYLTDHAARAAKIQELRNRGFPVEDAAADEPMLVLRDWFDCRNV